MSTISAGTTLTTALVQTGDTTGTLSINTGASNTNAITVDASQNVGIGVTPSASNLPTIQSTYALLSGNSQTNIICNGYYNSGFKYIGTGAASHYRQLSGAHEFYTATSGTAGNAISFTQALTLNTSGNLVLQGGNTAANGVGITFPATQSASSDANTLDDYEEGTWTPVLRFNGGTTGITYTSQVGQYVKIGKQITISFYFLLSNKGSSTGIASIVGIPFAASGTPEYVVPLNLYQSFNSVTSPVGVAYLDNSLISQLRAGNSYSDLQDTNFSNTSWFWGTCTYNTTT